MKVSAYSAYNPVMNGNADLTRLDEQYSKEMTVDKEDISKKNPNNLISQKERAFFMSMFPDNSEQLENHIVFNRSGKIQSHNLYKGTIIDGRA